MHDIQGEKEILVVAGVLEPLKSICRCASLNNSISQHRNTIFLIRRLHCVTYDDIMSSYPGLDAAESRFDWVEIR